MKIRIFAFGLASLMLCACTDQDWNHALTFVGVNDKPGTATAPQSRPAARRALASPAPASPAPANPVQQAQAPQAQPQAPRVNQFCESVAQQDSQGNDFDAPTQQRVFVRSYQQCVAIFGDATQ